VPFGVGGDFDAEPVAGFGADKLDQLVGVAEFAGFCHARGQVTTQCDDAFDADSLVLAQDFANAGAGRADTGEMWCGSVAFGGDFLDHGKGAFAGRATGAVGDREEFRIQFCQFGAG
jgi:hypothetical protein